MGEIGDTETTLPRGIVLGYVAAITTPTRVRVVSSRVIFWFGIASAAVSLFFLSWVALWVYDQIALWFGGPSWAGFAWALKRDEVRAALVLPGAYFVLASLFWMLVIPVRRGWPRACRTCVVLAAFLVLPISLAILMISTSAMVSALGLAGHRDYSELWRTLLLVPLPFIVLIFKDLCVFLGWIARNPIAERDASLFLPRPERS